jgi:hypothetical protein
MVYPQNYFNCSSLSSQQMTQKAKNLLYTTAGRRKLSRVKRKGCVTYIIMFRGTWAALDTVVTKTRCQLKAEDMVDEHPTCDDIFSLLEMKRGSLGHILSCENEMSFMGKFCPFSHTCSHQKGATILNMIRKCALQYIPWDTLYLGTYMEKNAICLCVTLLPASAPASCRCRYKSIYKFDFWVY